jgi:D-ribulokinase
MIPLHTDHAPMQPVFAGIDVGTSSARAGLFDATGHLVATAKHPIEIWREPGDIVEQSSDDIWAACCVALKAAIAEAEIPAEAIIGLGFDATCSLVALDAAGRPVTVSTSGEGKRNVIVWMDHRALTEASDIDASGSEVLRYVGGRISPEMEMPKLLWLKRHMPREFGRGAHFLDLADFLTFRATGSLARSSCTVTCKWTYLAHENRWDDGFLAAIGLPELAADRHRRIGGKIVAPGTPLATGLTRDAAADLGLAPGTPVGAGLIDAHAGGVGTLGGRNHDGTPADPLRRLGYIMGTSSCIMATTLEPVFVPGVWGPYLSAMVPGQWLNEGGQTTAGAALDHIVRAHPAHAAAQDLAARAGLPLLDFLEKRLVDSVDGLSNAALRARDLHILPDFLGNRSPFADPNVLAVIAGLSLEETIEDLDRHFVAGLCGIAYGLNDVIDAIRRKGIESHTIVVSGGASRSRLVRQILADVTGCAVVRPATEEPVLLGAAMLGAVACGRHASLSEAMTTMARDGEPSDATPIDIARFHAAKHEVHRMLQQLDRNSRATMASFNHA